MSLINCPECDKRISEYAPHCPHCGYSLNHSENNHTTIELTKKKYKIQDVLSKLLIIIGILFICNENSRIIGVLIMTIGAGWNLLTGIKTWWHHG